MDVATTKDHGPFNRTRGTDHAFDANTVQSRQYQNVVKLSRKMSTVQEIKTAIAQLDAHDRALLTAELFATGAEPDAATLEAALERGLSDVAAGRVRPIEDVKA